MYPCKSALAGRRIGAEEEDGLQVDRLLHPLYELIERPGKPRRQPGVTPE